MIFFSPGYMERMNLIVVADWQLDLISLRLKYLDLTGSSILTVSLFLLPACGTHFRFLHSQLYLVFRNLNAMPMAILCFPESSSLIVLSSLFLFSFTLSNSAF